MGKSLQLQNEKARPAFFTGRVALSENWLLTNLQGGSPCVHEFIGMIQQSLLVCIH